MTTAVDPGFRAALAGEWTKFASLRSVRLTLLLGTVLGIGATALLGWAVLATWDGWSAADRAEFEPVQTALIGTILTSVLFVVLGVTTVSSEYSSRMVLLTFTATPRRERVLLAKVLVVAVTTLVATAVAVLGMILVARLMFAGLDRPGPGAGTVVRVVLSVAANATFFPVLAVALTFLLRSAAGSVAALLGLIFGPVVLSPLLPAWFATKAYRYLPGPAMDALTVPDLSDGDPLGRGTAAVIVAAWLAAFLGAALAVLRRRDV